LLLTLPLIVGSVGCGAADSGTTPNPGALELVVEGGSQVEVGATVKVTASVANAGGLLITYSWTVSDPQGTPVSHDGGGKTISFSVAEPGSYRVACQAQIEGWGGRDKTISVEVGNAAAQLTYRARITPPPQSGVPPFDESVTIADGALQTHDFSAGDPRVVSMKVRWNGAPLATHVSALLTADDPRPQRVYLPAGQGSLSLVSGATLLLMPQAPAAGVEVAPLTRSVGVGAAAIAVDLDAATAGLTVEGKVERGGAAITGATVTLRTVDSATGVTLPSTVATTDNQGAYTVLARAGKATVLVVPPADSALPVAQVVDAKLDLKAAVSGWTFRYAAADASAEIGGKVVDAAGKALAGATVVLSAKTLPNVGQLELPGGQSFTASGRYRRTLATDATGALVAAGKALIRVPKGSYAVEILPPAGAAASITQRELQIDGSQTLALSAARKAAVSGVVRNVDGETVSARVELRGPYGPVVGLAQSDGSFELSVDRGFAYTLAVRPLDASVGAPLWQPALLIDADKSLESLKLPRATRLSGALREGSGAAIPGALIQIYCEEADCARQGLVDEARTDKGGRYELRVPRAGATGSAP
jgi:hypothetical protein